MSTPSSPRIQSTWLPGHSREKPGLVSKKRGKITTTFMGRSTITMAIFNSKLLNYHEFRWFHHVSPETSSWTTSPHVPHRSAAPPASTRDSPVLNGARRPRFERRNTERGEAANETSQSEAEAHPDEFYRDLMGDICGIWVCLKMGYTPPTTVSWGQWWESNLA